MRALMFALALAIAPAAYAQSAQNASDASAETSEAAAALTESGVKTASGVVALPLGSAAVAGVSAAAVATGAAGALVDSTADASQFANEPLSVSREVVLAPAPAPNVPYEAQTDGRQP